jgi:hypothetical protein
MNFNSPGAAASGNRTVVVVTTATGELEWSSWNLGEAGTPWAPLQVKGQPIFTDSAPAVSFRTSGTGAILVVAIKDKDSGFLFEALQGADQSLNGWVQIPGIVTTAAPAVSDGNLALGIPTMVALSAPPDGQLRINNYLNDQPPLFPLPADYWRAITPTVKSSGAPAAAVVNEGRYIFIAANVPTDSGPSTLQLVQGGPFAPEMTVSDMNFRGSVSPAMASANNRTVIVATDNTGEMFYDWWDFGGAGHGWVSLGNDVKTQVTPALALVDRGKYMFALATDAGGEVRTFQGVVGGAAVGWR